MQQVIGFFTYLLFAMFEFVKWLINLVLEWQLISVPFFVLVLTTAVVSHFSKKAGAGAGVVMAVITFLVLWLK